jgi:hypothetical protein
MVLTSLTCNLPLLIVTIIADLIAIVVFVFRSSGWSMRKKLISLILFFVLSAVLYYVSFLPAIAVANPQTQPSINSAETSAPFVAASPTQKPAMVYETTAVPTQTATAEPSVTAEPTHPISGTYDMSAEEPDSYKNGMAAYEKQDFGTAVPYLTEAAARGYAPAQYLLGECYRMGAGVKVNEKMAFTLYKLAADQYYANGLLWVGYCYHHGIGVVQDYDLAGEYYIAAQKAGHKNADDRIGELMQDMLSN